MSYKTMSVPLNLYIKGIVLFTGMLFLAYGQSTAQTYKGILKGQLMDASTRRPLYGATVSKDSTSLDSTTYFNGHYVISLAKGNHTVYFSMPGYHTKAIRGVKIQRNETTTLDILLFPDSINGQSRQPVTFSQESKKSIYNFLNSSTLYSDKIASANIQPGTDKNGMQLLKRLGGVIVMDHRARGDLQSLNISGMGERYNQVLLNGLVFNSLDATSKAYPLSLLPSEAIEAVSVQTYTNGSIPADFGGGTVNIRMKDIPDHNFFYVQAGAGFSDKTIGEDFYGDKRGDLEILGLPGSQRSISDQFPTSRSESTLNQKNIQEQVYLSKLLKNNLAPINQGSSALNNKAMIGFGRVIRKKSGTKIGIVAYLTQQKTERIDSNFVQVRPDVAGNPFPFDRAKQLIRSQSNDINYRYSSQLSGIANAAIIFGHNKISWKNFLGNTFDNSFTQRSKLSKPDEDPLAHYGINYQTQQGKFINSQLSGEHVLGQQRRLKFDWQVAYTYYRQQDPDERNFLLRQDSIATNRFEIARQASVPDFTRTGRGWKEFTDNNFAASFNLSVPFNVMNRPQLLAGGVYIETRDRLYTDDFILNAGTGYYPLDSLIAPERYYPGGLVANNYYLRESVFSGGTPDQIAQNYRGNYTASSNLGATYLRLESQLMKFLKLDWGIRLESYNQLVSNVQYYFLEGYKNEQMTSIDANKNVISFDLLPTAKLMYQPIETIQAYASYFKTVNRAQLQELSGYSFYDPISFTVKTGNTNLRNTEIQNYAAGLNWLPNAGTSIAVSGFYKEINQPIEHILSSYNTGNLLSIPHNTPPATVRGLTGTFKMDLSTVFAAPMLPISVFANGTLLKSKVDAGYIRSAATPEIGEHTLTGTPDYTVNAGIVIKYAAYPQLTVNYNTTDDYITALGSGEVISLDNGKNLNSIPHYRVKGRSALDLQISQKFLASRIQLIAGVHNLISSDYITYQDLNGNEKFDDALITVQPNWNGASGNYISGTDNTIFRQQNQRTFYFTLSYLFN